jgi:hypothetical protein
MSTYRDNTPNFNTGKKIIKFDEFSKEKEIKDLEDLKRTFKKNSDSHRIPKNSKYRYNKITQKMDDLSNDEVVGKIDAIKESKNVELESVKLVVEYLKQNPGVGYKQAMVNLGIV